MAVEVNTKTDEKIPQTINDEVIQPENSKKLDIAENEIPIQDMAPQSGSGINEVSSPQNENVTLSVASKKRAHEEISNIESCEKINEAEPSEMKETVEEKPSSPALKRLKLDE